MLLQDTILPAGIARHGADTIATTGTGTIPSPVAPTLAVVAVLCVALWLLRRARRLVAGIGGSG